MEHLEQLKVEELASLLGLDSSALTELAQKAPRLYREKKLAKKSGAVRIIEAPHDVLKKTQRLLLNKVLVGLPVDRMLHGGKGSSTIKAVSPHVRKAVVMTLDIRDFFPSVTSRMVRTMLRKRGASEDVARLLTRIVTRKHHLPQGAPTSPCIARLVLHPVAGHVRRALQSVGTAASASIYVDDVTVSGPPGIDRLRNTIVNIIERHGFRVHPDKVKIMPTEEEQESLGIRLNNGIEPTPAFLTKLDETELALGSAHPRVRGMHGYARSLRRAQSVLSKEGG